ncbi:hypothetical protein ACIRBY_32295 [Streptomyces sp. NPDC096136]|uniref:hypothetical protein n=1 Tax=Streptomyces sp. NPDC096136 TaxID=3366076 RepID=UPI003805DA6A
MSVESEAVEEEVVDLAAPPFGVPAVAFATPIDRDPMWDKKNDLLLLPVDVVYRDATKARTVLRITPGRVELLYSQLDRALRERDKAKAPHEDDDESSDGGVW